MWPQENSTIAGGSWDWEGWRVPAQNWPLLVGIFCGGALVLLLIVTAILWRCCVAPHRNKDYRVKGDVEAMQQRTVVPVLPSNSAVYLDPKCSQWSYNSRLVTSECGHWFYNKHVLSPATLERCTVPRSISVPTHQDSVEASRPPRPHSQPPPLTSNTRVIFPESGHCSLPLPQISEFSPGTQYASSSILDECGSRRLYPSSLGGTMLKTQSLPACVRSKPRPLSNADDPAELYAKVNFSKKRKNRMRNDEAAIIALSKSRSQFLHKDTDSLVDNEAVVVYDERTAL